MTDSMRAILIDLLLHGPLPRAELARRLSLSPASLTKLTRPLIDVGLLVERDRELQPGTGRPSQPLELLPDWQHVVGVKINPDDIFAVRTDLRAVVLEERDARLASQDIPTVVEEIASTVETLDPRGTVETIGVSLAANIRPGESVVRESPYLGWSNVPLGALLTQRTGRSIVLANDVRALTTAQHWFGAGRQSSCFGVLTVGKGIGCGLVVNDAVVAGYDGHAGLVSHVPINEGGPICRRGHRGCASSYLTSGAISRAIAASPATTSTRTAGSNLAAALDAARAGSPPEQRVFRDACYALGVVTAVVANVIGPDRIVLSGEGIGMVEVAPEAIRQGIDEHIHWGASPFELDVQPFAFSEWARGAAAVAIQSLLRPPGGRATTLVTAHNQLEDP
jgi:predicted NBD/HSP70 family sugar kinase